MSRMEFDTTNGSKKAVYQNMMDRKHANMAFAIVPRSSRRSMRHTPYSNDYYQMRCEEKALDAALAEANEQLTGGGAE